MGKLTDGIRESWHQDDEQATEALDGVTNLFDRLEAPGLQVPIAAIGLGTTAVLWFLLIEFHPVREFMFYLPDNAGKALFWLLCFKALVVFGFPFFGMNALGHILMPSTEEDEEFPQTGFMSGYQQQDKSQKRWRLIVLSGMFGALNVGLMFWLL